MVDTSPYQRADRFIPSFPPVMFALLQLRNSPLVVAALRAGPRKLVMTALPADLRVRPFKADADVPRLVRLLHEAETVDHSGELISEEMVRLYLSALHHNPHTDRWVIEDPEDAGKLIAHAALYLPTETDDRRVADGMLVVHPAWRLKGLGTELFAWLEARLKGSGADTRLLRFYLDPMHEAAVAFARFYSLEPFEPDTYTEMRAVVSDIEKSVSLPEGFTLRSYRDVAHLPTLVEAFDRGHEGLHGHRHATEEDLKPRLAELDWDGNLLLFAPDGKVAGAVGAALEPGLPSATVSRRAALTVLESYLNTVHWSCTRRCCLRASPTRGS